MNIKVEIQDKVYDVSIKDIHARPVIAQVDGVNYEVWPEQAAAAPQPAASAEAAPVSRPAAPAAPAAAPVAAASSLTLNAPLPGTIAAVLVREGEKVTAGQEVITLEAMKMKNAIRADRDGVVAAINVNIGDLVKHNQPLITFQG